VREFCEVAFAHVGLDYRKFVIEDLTISRPPEATQLVGDPAKAQRVLGWKPKVGFQDLVRMMVDADLELIRVRHVAYAGSGNAAKLAKTEAQENLS
jgi:GDPmannose 4,6-dehydratase